MFRNYLSRFTLVLALAATFVLSAPTSVRALEGTDNRSGTTVEIHHSSDHGGKHREKHHKDKHHQEHQGNHQEQEHQGNHQ